RVAARLVRNERGITEADVDGGRRLEPFERAVDRVHGVATSGLHSRLEPGLVELDDVGARGLDVLRLGVDGVGERHRAPLVIAIVLVLYLLRERERSRQRDSDPARGGSAQELDVADRHGPRAAHRADDSRHGGAFADPIDDRAGPLDVDPFERGRETVRVALAAHLAVGDHVEAGALHVADREQRGFVLRRVEAIRWNAPQLVGAYARYLAREPRAIDQPIRLRIAAADRRLDHSNALVWSVFFGVRSPASKRASSACASARRRAAICSASGGSSVSSSFKSSGVVT